MSILSGAEFVFAFYEELPHYLATKYEGKTYAKDYKKLRSFLQKTKSTLGKIRDDVSVHAAREQKIFVDAMMALAEEYLTSGCETEAATRHKQTIEYSLFVWGLLSPLPKKIAKLSRDTEKANESHYYSIEKLTDILIHEPKQFAFYSDMFRMPFEKIKRAADNFRTQYIHLATAARSEEGMVFATSMAETMKKMYYGYTLIYEFLNLTLMTSKYVYVTMLNSMPKIVLDALSHEVTPAEAKKLHAYVKRLEKLCKQNDWMKHLRIEIPTDELLATEGAPAPSVTTPIDESEFLVDVPTVESEPTEETPIEEAPIEEAQTAEETPAEEATEQAPIEEAETAEEAPIEVAPAEEESTATETAQEATAEEATEQAPQDSLSEQMSEEVTAEEGETAPTATEETSPEDDLADVL